MQVERLTELLRAVQAGQTSVDAALDVLRDLPYETVADYARLDHHRSLRIGLPEVIYGAGKTPEQIARLLERLTAANGLAVATRVSAEQAQAVQALLPAALYHAMPRILTLGMAPALPADGLAIWCMLVMAMGSSRAAWARTMVSNAWALPPFPCLAGKPRSKCS